MEYYSDRSPGEQSQFKGSAGHHSPSEQSREQPDGGQSDGEQTKGAPVMVIMFALAAAVLYGSADFLGGAASRHSRALSVAALSVPVGALVMLGAAVVSGGQAPS